MGMRLTAAATMADLDVHALLTATEAAAYAGVTVQAIINWRTRGYINQHGEREHLQPAGTKSGRPAYRLLDLAIADRATGKRARRR